MPVTCAVLCLVTKGYYYTRDVTRRATLISDTVVSTPLMVPLIHHYDPTLVHISLAGLVVLLLFCKHKYRIISYNISKYDTRQETAFLITIQKDHIASTNAQPHLATKTEPTNRYIAAAILRTSKVLFQLAIKHP